MDWTDEKSKAGDLYYFVCEYHSRNHRKPLGDKCTGFYLEFQEWPKANFLAR